MELQWHGSADVGASMGAILLLLQIWSWLVASSVGGYKCGGVGADYVG
jgi:hypothetical protein